MAAKKKDSVAVTDGAQPEVMHQPTETLEVATNGDTVQESGKATALSIKGHATLSDAQLMTTMPSQYVAINALAVNGDTSVISDCPSAKLLESIIDAVKKALVKPNVVRLQEVA